jgi:uncharacterized RDD family membrane protein YckC
MELMETHDRASLKNRIFATLIDYIVIGSFFTFIVYYYGEPNENGGYSLYGAKALIPIAFWFIYLIVIESNFNATAGHYLLGLKVKRIDNDEIDFIDSLKRHLLDPIDFYFLGIPAIICIKNTALNQRIGDLWAKTIVVNDKEK